jgi:hypothetical protein
MFKMHSTGGATIQACLLTAPLTTAVVAMVLIHHCALKLKFHLFDLYNKSTAN